MDSFDSDDDNVVTSNKGIGDKDGIKKEVPNHPGNIGKAMPGIGPNQIPISGPNLSQPVLKYGQSIPKVVNSGPINTNPAFQAGNQMPLIAGQKPNGMSFPQQGYPNIPSGDIPGSVNPGLNNMKPSNVNSFNGFGFNPGNQDSNKFINSPGVPQNSVNTGLKNTDASKIPNIGNGNMNPSNPNKGLINAPNNFNQGFMNQDIPNIGKGSNLPPHPMLSQEPLPPPQANQKPHNISANYLKPGADLSNSVVKGAEPGPINVQKIKNQGINEPPNSIESEPFPQSIEIKNLEKNQKVLDSFQGQNTNFNLGNQNLLLSGKQALPVNPSQTPQKFGAAPINSDSFSNLNRQGNPPPNMAPKQNILPNNLPIPGQEMNSFMSNIGPGKSFQSEQPFFNSPIENPPNSEKSKVEEGKILGLPGNHFIPKIEPIEPPNKLSNQSLNSHPIELKSPPPPLLSKKQELNEKQDNFKSRQSNLPYKQSEPFSKFPNEVIPMVKNNPIIETKGQDRFNPLRNSGSKMPIVQKVPTIKINAEIPKDKITLIPVKYTSEQTEQQYNRIFESLLELVNYNEFISNYDQIMASFANLSKAGSKEAKKVMDFLTLKLRCEQCNNKDLRLLFEINCSHLLCKLCLEKAALQSIQKKIFQCPCCRKQIKDSEESEVWNILGLNKNQIKITELQKKFKIEKQLKCKRCKRFRKSFYNCCLHVCKECFAESSRWKIAPCHRCHDMIPYNNLVNETFKCDNCLNINFFIGSYGRYFKEETLIFCLQCSYDFFNEGVNSRHELKLSKLEKLELNDHIFSPCDACKEEMFKGLLTINECGHKLCEKCRNFQVCVACNPR